MPTVDTEPSTCDDPQYGISQPICLKRPTDDDIKDTKNLEEELRRLGVFETEADRRKRIGVLQRIDSLVKLWVKRVSEEKNLPPDLVKKAGGKLFIFGSYRLGVHTKGADIDTLCVAPRHVDRADFFSSFYDLLKEDSDVTNLHAVKDAFVPVIRLMYDNIELDILFAKLALTDVTDDQTLDDNNLLRNLDEKSIRSLNGCRVADEILRSIPNRQNFAVALRAIKIWAKNHSIYSNSLGFFGGVSWAILVARICQLYPYACPSVLVEKFFYIFGTWEWPHPVFLKDVNDTDVVPQLNDLVWDSRNRVQDRFDLMPIITPAYPEQNSTFNVTVSTQTIICNELRETMAYFFHPPSKKHDWKYFLEEVNFFSRYRHFICLLCVAKDEEDHLVFSSLVESKIRRLIAFFERNVSVSLCHINPKKFKPLPNCELGCDYKNPIATLWFLGIELKKDIKKKVDLTLEIQLFNDLVLKAANAAHIYKETMIVRPFYVRRNELCKWVSQDDLSGGRTYRNKPSLTANDRDTLNPPLDKTQSSEINAAKKRKGFYSPPTIVNQTLLAAAAEAAAANATNELPARTMSGSEQSKKRPKFSYLSSPQNGTVH